MKHRGILDYLKDFKNSVDELILAEIQKIIINLAKSTEKENDKENDEELKNIT